MSEASKVEPAEQPVAQPDTRAASEAMLIASAKRWVGEALDARTEDDHAKVGLLAPMAVEHLGKATLWRDN